MLKTSKQQIKNKEAKLLKSLTKKLIKTTKKAMLSIDDANAFVQESNKRIDDMELNHNRKL